MTTLDALNGRILELNEKLKQLYDAKISEEKKMSEELSIIEECKRVIGDEDKLIHYDFKGAVELLDKYENGIDNLMKIISDIQNALSVRQELKLNVDDLPLAENQLFTLSKFMDSLLRIKKKLEEKRKELEIAPKEEETVGKLEELKRVLEGNGRKKYVTEGMFSTFYNEFDVRGLPLDDVSMLLDDFYQTRNISMKVSKEKVDIGNVVQLFREYFNDDNMRYFKKLLVDHTEEVERDIDLSSAQEVLEWFKEKELLNKFMRNTLFKIVVYGNVDYIRDIYSKIVDSEGNIDDVYFKDDLATIWVKENSSLKRAPHAFRTSRGKSTKSSSNTLFRSCHSIDYNEFIKNVQTLQKYRDILDENLDVDDIGANVHVTTLPNWILEKNLSLCNLFGMGTVSKVALSCIDRGNIEDKIHLAIELGLFNPPRSQKFLEMDKNIVKNDVFLQKNNDEKVYNQSIRNYFQRFSSVLAFKSINEYAYLTYKLSTLGYEDFYNEFFSNHRAGAASAEIFSNVEWEMISDRERMNEFVSEKFMTDWYSELIPHYDEYDMAISDAVETKTIDDENPYFDESILAEPLLQEMEAKYSVIDLVEQNGEIVEQKNPYVYLIGDVLISRYKVLRNVSILKTLYSSLKKEMLITSIVRNSFLDSNAFQTIQNEVKEMSRAR